MAYYNDTVAQAVALNIDDCNQEQLIHEVYQAVKNEGFLVSEEDVANSVKLILTFNLYRGN